MFDFFSSSQLISVFVQAVIRVRFPDNYILEIKFKPSEKIQSLVDLLMKVVARPDFPFYLCKYCNVMFFASSSP